MDESKFEEDPLITAPIKEPQLFDSQIENKFYLPIDNRSFAFVSTKINPEQAKPAPENNVLPPTRETTPDLDASAQTVRP